MKRAAKLSFPTRNSNLLISICARTNKISCTIVSTHFSWRESWIFRVWKKRVSHTLRITYVLQKIWQLEMLFHSTFRAIKTFMENASQWQLFALLSLGKILSGHLQTFFALHTQDVIGGLVLNLGSEIFFQPVNFIFFLWSFLNTPCFVYQRRCW